MKTPLLYLFIVCTICISCSGTKKTITANTAGITKSSNLRDGSSYDKAIIIQQTSETRGIADEYTWIRNKYPNSKTKSQSLSYKDKKPFDIINIVTAEGNDVAVYFDISNFLGKF